MKVTIERLGIDQADIALEWVGKLLDELGAEGKELGTLDRDRILDAWKMNADRVHVFAARSENNGIVGVLTLVENFAIYTNGHYGLINELLVSPEHRGSGIGARLIEAVKELGRSRGWTRIEVTTPEEERWLRTRQFYRHQGFVIAGPKLKFLLQSDGPH